MNELEQKIHDYVKGSAHPVNSNQVFQALKDTVVDVTLQEVRDAMENLEQKGFIVNARLASYYAVG